MLPCRFHGWVHLTFRFFILYVRLIPFQDFSLVYVYQGRADHAFRLVCKYTNPVCTLDILHVGLHVMMESLEWSVDLDADVISIAKTNENFRLLYDSKGRFTLHHIDSEEAKVLAALLISNVHPRFYQHFL